MFIGSSDLRRMQAFHARACLLAPVALSLVKTDLAVPRSPADGAGDPRSTCCAVLDGGGRP